MKRFLSTFLFLVFSLFSYPLLAGADTAEDLGQRSSDNTETALNGCTTNQNEDSAAIDQTNTQLRQNIETNPDGSIIVQPS